VNNKDRAVKIIFQVAGFLRPIALTLLLVAALQATGLMSSVSYVGHLALLQTGLMDADDDVLSDSEDFDYHFTIKDLSGNKVSFESYRGRVIFLNMWATWCAPCRAEMAGIQKLYSKVDQGKIAFVMLSIDKDSDREKVVSYLKKQNFTFQAFQPSGYLPKQLDVPAIPTTFIISKEGKIVKKEVGNKRYNTSRFQKFLEDLSL
jgi:thiol-disulfide isomerase/thioredoxin